MTNYSERINDVLYRFAVDTHESKPGQDETPNFDRAKQAITSLYKELVAEAKPLYYTSPDKSKYQDGFNTCIRLYEQNLLKELEEI